MGRRVHIRRIQEGLRNYVREICLPNQRKLMPKLKQGVGDIQLAWDSKQCTSLPVFGSWEWFLSSCRKNKKTSTCVCTNMCKQATLGSYSCFIIIQGCQEKFVSGWIHLSLLFQLVLGVYINKQSTCNFWPVYKQCLMSIYIYINIYILGIL